MVNAASATTLTSWCGCLVILDQGCWSWDPRMYDLRVTTSNYSFGELPSRNQENEFRTTLNKVILCGQGIWKIHNHGKLRTGTTQNFCYKAAGWNFELRNFNIPRCATHNECTNLKITHNLEQEVHTIRFWQKSTIPRASGSILVRSIWMWFSSSPPPPLNG